MFTFLYNETQGQNDDSNPYFFIQKFIQFSFSFIYCISFLIGLTTCYFLGPLKLCLVYSGRPALPTGQSKDSPKEKILYSWLILQKRRIGM